MIKSRLPAGEVEVIIGKRYCLEDEPLKYEAHIYLNRGNEMHGAYGKTPDEALFDAVVHWRKSKEK